MTALGGPHGVAEHDTSRLQLIALVGPQGLPLLCNAMNCTTGNYLHEFDRLPIGSIVHDRALPQSGPTSSDSRVLEYNAARSRASGMKHIRSAVALGDLNELCRGAGVIALGCSTVRVDTLSMCGARVSYSSRDPAHTLGRSWATTSRSY
jgi:hypothetical protein